MLSLFLPESPALLSNRQVQHENPWHDSYRRERLPQEEEDTDLADKDWEVWDDSPAPAAAFPVLLGYELNPSPVREVCVYFGPLAVIYNLVR